MSRQVGAQPVRSAPLRRGRKNKREPIEPAGIEPTESATVSAELGESTAEAVAGGSEPTDSAAAPAEDTTEVVEGADDFTEVPAEAVEPSAEPAERSAEPVDGTGEPAAVSYRERRAKRQGSTPSRPVERRARVGRGAGGKWVVAGVVCALFIVACVVASTFFAVGTSRLDHQNELRASYSGFARQMTIDLTSLNPGNVDKALQTVQDKTSGPAQQRIKQSMAQVTDLIRTQNQTVTSSVVTDAVTKATDDEGSVIVVYGWEMKSQDPKQETVIQTFRWRVDITRINGDLKMTNFEWVV
ncbi:hypothetical protein [Gordonia sp. 852002-10350_SCH5691597]|uniref:hypothetical protein n=1 Tax=Gordonia sp. 852002-10350_SCH5691597 TaxID=1834085 RepID=UPI0007E98369|nr:hypothetical protein [Gordonia sp. 852002-10350_SCH5691597]OBA67170.1 hypothetical protein A5777_17515 [Gordonia sp. 852002-10350_SCH5691597]